MRRLIALVALCVLFLNSCSTVKDEQRLIREVEEALEKFDDKKADVEKLRERLGELLAKAASKK